MLGSQPYGLICSAEIHTLGSLANTVQIRFCIIRSGMWFGNLEEELTVVPLSQFWRPYLWCGRGLYALLQSSLRPGCDNCYSQNVAQDLQPSEVSGTPPLIGREVTR